VDYGLIHIQPGSTHGLNEQNLVWPTFKKNIYFIFQPNSIQTRDESYWLTDWNRLWYLWFSWQSTYISHQSNISFKNQIFFYWQKNKINMYHRGVVQPIYKYYKLRFQSVLATILLRHSFKMYNTLYLNVSNFTNMNQHHNRLGYLSS